MWISCGQKKYNLKELIINKIDIYFVYNMIKKS